MGADFENLRRRAETIIQEKNSRSIPGDTELLTLIHELEVHQVELKLQNEELVRTSKELAESRNEYKNLYDSAPVGFISINPRGLIERVNKAAIELLDLPKRLLIGRTFIKFIHPEDQETYFALFGKASAGEKKMSETLRLVTTGNTTYVRIEIGGRNDAGVRLAMIDITRMIEGEKELQRAKDELEMKVKARTSELEHAKRELEEFVQVASHDLQEPLRKIQTFADKLLKTGDNPSFHLDRIRAIAGKMQALVLDLLKYSKATTNLPVRSRVDLKGVIEDVIVDLSVLFDMKEGSVQIAELPEVMADRTLMYLLFQNLIGNSLKYSGDRKPVVKVYSNSRSSKNTWEIYVEDNGIGFDAKYLNKIFKPFQRLHPKNSSYEGTGIGLAICRRIVERHGGSITAQSNPGKGATFIISLPKEKR
jgi:PAS domain S-box-containing protein